MAKSNFSFPNLPIFKAEVMPIYWEPVMGSGERFTALLAAIGEDGEFVVVSTISQPTLKILYNNQSILGTRILSWIADSLKTYVGRNNSLLGWEAPLSGIYMGERIELLGNDLQDVINQAKTLYSSLYSSESVEVADDAFDSLNNEKLRKLVIDDVRKKVGLSAESFIVDGGTIEVKDDDRIHFLEIPIKSDRKVANIVSAWYKSPFTIERNLLVASNHLLVASERGKYQQGVFISRPYAGLNIKQVDLVDNKLDFLIWSMKKNGVFAAVQESHTDLATELCEWIS